MNLVLVESPTKARTLARFLGDGYVVQATYGHVRDLPERKLGIKISKVSKGEKAEFEFAPEYVVNKKQEGRISEIKKQEKAAGTVFLATDPDREGEAIAWHTAMLLSPRAKSIGSKFKRIVFHEITKGAIMAALAHPKTVDSQLVDAQQARRILDRLVGYKLSPLLWKKVRRGLSAGRVQSVAVRLVVERERQIEAFKPQEYWDIQVVLQKLSSLPAGQAGLPVGQLTVKLMDTDDQKVEIRTTEEAKQVEDGLRGAHYAVESVEKRDVTKVPPAPFTTSVLQQTAANRFGWSAKKTMQVAQSLYEEGLITYHRTDSTNIADEAALSAREYIAKTYGGEYALASPRVYKTKSKVAQEAHEAIRPTEVGHQPDDQNVMANRDQIRLYEAIWKRFVASQMAEVRGESVKVRVTGLADKQKYGLEARGETISFDGWQRLEGDKDSDGEVRLPEVVMGEVWEFVNLTNEQKFTQAPARYNDASIIKVLEEMGIGRPSTYAPTISTVLERQYVERVDPKTLMAFGGRGNRFKPTSLGIAVSDFLVANFPKIVDYAFTAGMEDQLDEIARGEKEWMPVVSQFYEPFEKLLEKVADTAQRVKVEVEATGEKCPKCQVGDEVIRLGKFGKFLACSRYPECDYKATFINKIGMPCPTCTSSGSAQVGEVIIKRTRSGKSFYGCSRYPDCKFASWTKPVAAAAGPPADVVLKEG